MQINPTFAFASGSTQSDVAAFESAVNNVIAFFDSTFSSNVTINVNFAYGEFFSSTSNNNSTINYALMPNASAGGFFSLGTNTAPLNPTSYSALVGALQNKSNGLQAQAYGTVPSSSPFGGDVLVCALVY